MSRDQRVPAADREADVEDERAGRVRRKRLSWAHRLGLAVAVVAFVSLALARAVQDGVCCADDALFAVAAKDLARGHGYTQGGLERERAYFGLGPTPISVGPVLVLPVAAAIRALGNRHWVPGVVSVALWCALLLFVLRSLRPFGDAGRRHLAMALFLLLCFSFSVWHFEQWYAMLGEVHASLLTWLAVAVWAGRPRHRRNLGIASVLIGLAGQAKLVAVFCLPAFLCGVVMARGLRGRARLARAGRDVAASVSCALLPAVLFQGYQLLDLGPRQYLAENRRWLAFALAFGTSEEASPGVLARVAAYCRQASERFGVGPLELLLLSTVALVIVTRRGRVRLRLLTLVLFGGILTHVAWWLFVSKGWPRHLFIALVLSVALAVLPLLALRRPATVIAYVLLLLVCVLLNRGRLAHPLRSGAGGWFTPSRATENALAVAARVDAAPAGMTVFGQWWATNADLEYLSADVGRYRTLPRGPSPGLPAHYAVAFNSRFRVVPDPGFDGWLAGCRREDADRAPYELFWCGGAAEPSPAAR